MEGVGFNLDMFQAFDFNFDFSSVEVLYKNLYAPISRPHYNKYDPWSRSQNQIVGKWQSLTCEADLSDIVLPLYKTMNTSNSIMSM